MSRESLHIQFPSLSMTKRIILALVGCLLVVVIVATMPGSAATPSSGTLTNVSGPLTYTAGPFFVANVSAQANGTPICNAALPCDDFTLTVNVTAGTETSNNVKIAVQWPTSAADFDVYILQGSTVIATAASSADPEVAFIPAVNGTYTVRAVPFAPAGQSITGTISLNPIPPPPPSGSGPAPRFKNYPAPPGAVGADQSGEPSIGVDWNPNVASLKHDQVNTGGVAFFTSNLNVFRVSFDDCPSPSTALWEDVTSPTESVTSLDPIGFVDHEGTSPGRVFQSQLAGASSVMAFSDDDGGSWTQSQGSGQPAGVDHQTVGGGPYNNSATPPPPPHTYANQTYYCSQDAATAFCARSDNGGLTFNAGVPIYNLTQCGGLHGHVKVAPDGTVYVPNRSCSGNAAVVVSTDNGLTWAIRPVPGSTSGGTDPSLGIATDNTIYLGYQNGDNHPHIAVSHDRGLTWLDTDAGAGFIQNSVFPEVVAGDGGMNGRAAFGFLGTPTGGNYEDTTNFHGIWHFYIATTYDAGNTYILVDATPGDPVQIGSICTGGTTCGSDRNLLDFNDITVDKEGRVLVAYADGCLPPGCTETPPSPSTSSRSSLATIIRQSGGRRLFAAFDPIEPAPPGAPKPGSATRDSSGTITVTWSSPDDNGAPITAYKVYRGTTSGGETLLAMIPPTNKYLDITGDSSTTYFYRVTAVNANGEGPFCGEMSVTGVILETTCLSPGLTILTDPADDELDGLASHDIRKISISEPFGQAGNLVFTIKMASLSVVPVDTTWPVQFKSPTNADFFVKMQTNAAGTVSFAYGAGTSVTIPGTPADPASTFSPDGTITIVVPKSGIGNPMPGESLTQFLMRVRIEPGITPDNCPSDLGPAGSYTLVSACFCSPQTPPVASMTAVPHSGNAPLTVTFNGSSSTEQDACDTIDTYIFDFGDGSAPVTINSPSPPTLMHTYSTPKDYVARLKVRDSRLRFSDNTAQAVIEVAAAPTAASATISGTINTPDGAPLAGVSVRLSGALSATTFTRRDGSYRFANLDVDNFYIVTPGLVNYHFAPPSRSFSLAGGKADAIFTANPDPFASANATDTTEFFVRQQYLDFLGREPDQGGFEYWSEQINQCQDDAACVRSRRVGVSAAFFVEHEFQLTGAFIYDLYKGALGRRPAFAEYSADRKQVLGGPNLESEKTAFAEAFVQRAELTEKYKDDSTAELFVDTLIQNVRQSSGVDLSSQRDRYISLFQRGSNTIQSRGLVVRALADEASFKQAEYNAAFVLMQYFGYLRRNPDRGGYDFWLNVLNGLGQSGDPRNYRGMVCSFITSTEYQQRFSPVVSHSNSECAQ